MLFALGAQFEKDSNHLDESITDNIRCGFEAEFASEASRSTCGNYLEEHLKDRTGEVNVSDSYGASHNSTYQNWSVEFDSSIPTTSQYPNQVEIVSPIQGVEKTIADLSVVFDLIKEHGHTEQGTGLHMTFSIKDVNLRVDKFDHLKFLFLVGESYYAKFFGRVDYGYALEFLTVFKKKLVTYLEQVLDATITSSDCADFIKIHSSQPFASIVENIKTIGADADSYSKGLYALFLAYKDASSRLFDRYQSVNTQHLAENASRIEFRLPGGSGYEYKLEQCSRLMRVLANALWVSRAGMTQYDDYYAKKLTRLVLSAQAEARSIQAQDTAKHTYRIQTTQEGRNTVHQLMQFEKVRMHKPTATALASFVFSGNDVKHIDMYRDISGDAGEQFSELVKKFSEAQLWSIVGAVHCIDGHEAVCDGLDRPELDTLVLAIQIRPTLDFADIRSKDPQDWSIVSNIVDVIGQLSGKSRVWASAFALNYVVMSCLQFADGPYNLPDSDAAFKSVGQLVQWAKPVLSTKMLMYFKFWIWAKFDVALFEDLGGFDFFRSGEELKSLGSTQMRQRASLSYTVFKRMLSLARYRKICNSMPDELLTFFPASIATDLIHTGVISLKALSDPLRSNGLILVIDECLLAKDTHKETQEVLYLIYKTYGLSKFSELLAKWTTTHSELFSSGALVDLNSSNSLKDILSNLTESGIPDSAKSAISKAVATTVSTELRKTSAQTAVYSILLGIEAQPDLTLPDTLHILDSATESDLETFRSSSVVAFKLARAAGLLGRSGLKLPVNKALAKIYLKNPVWFSALAAVALTPSPNKFDRDSVWLFGIKPASFLRDLFANATELFPYIKRVISYVGHIDFCSLLQHIPVVDKQLAFGKGALDFLLKSLALGLMKYPWGNKSAFYGFPSYETRDYTGTLLPVLDYLAGQETKHRRTTIHLSDLNFIPPQFRYGETYEGTEPGPYFNLKVSRADVQNWRSSFTEKLNTKESFKYPIEKPASDSINQAERSLPPKVIYKAKHYSITGRYDLTKDEIKTFIDNASKADIILFLRTAFSDNVLQHVDAADFNTIREVASVSNNPDVWDAFYSFALSGSFPPISASVIDRWLLYVFSAFCEPPIPDTLYGVPYARALYDTLKIVSDPTNTACIPYSLLHTYEFALAIKDSNPDIYRLLMSEMTVKAIRQNVRKHVNKDLRGSSDAQIDTYNSRRMLQREIDDLLIIGDRTPLGDYMLNLLGRDKVASEVYKLHREHLADNTKPEPKYPWRSAFI